MFKTYAKLRGRRGALSPPARTVLELARSPVGRGRGLPNFSPVEARGASPRGVEERGADERGADERFGLSPKLPSGLRAYGFDALALSFELRSPKPLLNSRANCISVSLV